MGTKTVRAQKASAKSKTTGTMRATKNIELYGSAKPGSIAGLLAGHGRYGQIRRYHGEQMTKELGKGAKIRDAKRLATDATAKKFGESPRTVQRAVKKISGLERDVQAKFREDTPRMEKNMEDRHAVLSYLTPDESKNIRFDEVDLPKLASTAFWRAHEKAVELECRVAALKKECDDLKSKVRRLIEQKQQLERERLSY